MKTVYQLYLGEISSLVDVVIILVEDDDIEEAIDLTKKLLQTVSPDLLLDFVSIKTTLQRINREYNSNIISFDEYSRYRNKIIKSLLDILKRISDAANEGNDFSQFAKILQPHKSILELLEAGRRGKEDRLQKIDFLHKALRTANNLCQVQNASGQRGYGFLLEGPHIYVNSNLLPDVQAVDGAIVAWSHVSNGLDQPVIEKQYRLSPTDSVLVTKQGFTRVGITYPRGGVNTKIGFPINTSYAFRTEEIIYLISTDNQESPGVWLIASKILGEDGDGGFFYPLAFNPILPGQLILNDQWEPIALQQKASPEEYDHLTEQATQLLGTGFYLRLLAEETGRSAENPPIVQDKDGPKRFFLMYDPADQKSVQALKMHMHTMILKGQINLYDMHEFSVGNAEKERNAELDRADYILAIISYRFIFSIYEEWAIKAKARRKKIIPILLAPAELQGTFLETLRPLPSNGKPIEDWDNRDSAFVDIVTHLRKLILK